MLKIGLQMRSTRLKNFGLNGLQMRSTRLEKILKKDTIFEYRI